MDVLVDLGRNGNWRRYGAERNTLYLIQGQRCDPMTNHRPSPRRHSVALQVQALQQLARAYDQVTKLLVVVVVVVVVVGQSA